VNLKTQQQLLEKREEELLIREHLLDFNGLHALLALLCLLVFNLLIAFQ
jgi:hypothetical protein